MPAGKTYEPIATQTLGSAAASVTFSSISGAYTDLVLVANYIPTTQGNTIRLTFNSDSATNYSKTYVGAWTGNFTGSTRFSNYSYLFNLWQIGGVLGPNIVTFNIMNYSNTTTFKTCLLRASTVSSPDSEVSAEVGLWRSTAAINTILLTSSSTTFAIGSTFSLYGIKSSA
jgi:hypothetical protein